MADERARARRVLAAVRGLPPEVLEIAATTAPPDSAALIAAVRRALAAPDPEATLAEELRGVELDHPAVLRAAGALEDAPLAQAARWAAEVEPARASIDAVLAGRAQILLHAADARAGAADDPALARLVDHSVALLGDHGPFVALKHALASARELQDGLSRLADGRLDPAELARRAAELRTQRDAVAAAAAQLSRIPELVATARAYAASQSDVGAVAQLAVADAALRATEPGAEVRWRDALDAALVADDLVLARQAATRVELHAAAEGRLDAIAETAARVAELAARAEDAEAELAATGDQALALAQLPDGADQASALVAHAYALAEGDPILMARASLLEGQVLERFGDASGARRAFRQVMDLAREVDDIGHELGWAALHLGRLEGAAGQPFRASQDLELAQQLGQAAGDLTLFALAAAARIDLAADRRAAEVVLGEAHAAPVSVQAELRARIDERWPSA